jgi:hypothetical protein
LIGFALFQTVQDTSFVVIFDVSRQGYQTWREALIPLIPALIGFGVLRWSRVSGPTLIDKEPRLYHLVLRLSVMLGIFGTLAILAYTRREFEQLNNALKAGNYRITSGVVSGLVPELADGHPRESFDLSGRSFVYSSADVTSAFHQTVGTGGPVRDGLGVRIADVDGKILRLETFTPMENKK